jgi:hypothetical protein
MTLPHRNRSITFYNASKILEKIQADGGDVCSSYSLYTTKVCVVVQAVRRI